MIINKCTCEDMINLIKTHLQAASDLAEDIVGDFKDTYSYDITLKINPDSVPTLSVKRVKFLRIKGMIKSVTAAQDWQ